MNLRNLAVLMAFPLVIGVASAQQKNRLGEIVVAMADCRKITDDAQRLACLDRVSGDLVTAFQREEVVAVDREAIRETRKSLFGFTGPNLRLFGQSKEQAERDDIKELTGKITSVREISYGKYQFRIDDDSSWQTTETSSYADIDVGQPVRIRRSSVGSFQGFFNNSKQFVRVKRVQ